jgi:hypothetical protein
MCVPLVIGVPVLVIAVIAVLLVTARLNDE